MSALGLDIKKMNFASQESKQGLNKKSYSKINSKMPFKTRNLSPRPHNLVIDISSRSEMIRRNSDNSNENNCFS